MVIDWSFIKLGDVASVQSGYAFKSKDMGDYGAPIIKIKNIIPPNVDIENVQRIPYELIASNKRISNYALSKGDILIAMTGATVGKVGRVPISNETCYLNQRVGKVYIKEGVNACDYNYLYYILSQDKNVKQMFGMADGSAQANISGGQIESIEFYLPPLEEQKRIAHVLGTLDDKIELNRQMNETLEAMAQAIFKSWFIDFDGHDNLVESELGLIPEGWEVSTIKKVGNVICGKTPSTKDPSNYGKDMPFITIPDMHNQTFIQTTKKYLSSKGASSQIKKTIDVGDICISCIATPGLVVLPTEPSQTNQQINTLTPFDGNSFFWYFSLKQFKTKLLSIGSGGSTFTNVSKGRFEAMHVINPPSKLKLAFEQMVKCLMLKINLNQAQSKTLTELRDTLLPKLISGELRVPEALDIAEETLDSTESTTPQLNLL